MIFQTLWLVILFFSLENSRNQEASAAVRALIEKIQANEVIGEKNQGEFYYKIKTCNQKVYMTKKDKK